MAKNKKKNTSKKIKIRNKRYISYKQEMSSTKFTKMFITFILIIIFYNSISLTEEKVSTLRFLENFSNITMIIKSDDDDYKHKARTAARMEARLLTDVFYGQFQSVFIAEDRLMLRTVIHKRAADILHQRHSRDVAHKDQHAQHAFDQRTEIIQCAVCELIE